MVELEHCRDQAPGFEPSFVIFDLVQDNYGSVAAQSIFIPPDQVMDGTISLHFNKVVLDFLGIPQLLIFKKSPSLCCLPLSSIPVF